MKRKHLAFAFAALAVLTLALTAYGGGLSPFAVQLAGLMAGGLALGATMQTDITTDSTDEAHLVRDVSGELTYLRPDLYPMDTILRRSEINRGKKKAEQFKVEWEESDIIPRIDTVDGAATAGTGGSAKTVAVANGGRWRANDLVYLPDNATAPGAVLIVNGVSGNSLELYRVDDTDVPALADAETLRRLGNAKEEMSKASLPRAKGVDQLYNITEISDAVIGVSGTRLETKNYTVNDYDRAAKETLYDYRSSLEYKALFGKRQNKLYGSTRIRTMGGITYFLQSNDLTYSAGSLAEADLIDISQAVFSGNSGSRVRLWFMTPNQTAEIAKILIKTETLSSTRKETVLGVKATRVTSPFGDLMLINHQGMEEMGKSNYGLIVDPAHIRRRPLRQMRKKDVTSPDVDGREEQWLEEATLEVRYEATHAVVRDAATDSFD